MHFLWLNLKYFSVYYLHYDLNLPLNLIHCLEMLDSYGLYFVKACFLICLQYLYCPSFNFAIYLYFAFIPYDEHRPLIKCFYLFNLFIGSCLRLYLFINCFAVMSYFGLLFNMMMFRCFLIYEYYLFLKMQYSFLNILQMIVDHFVFFNLLNLQFILKDF